MGICCYTKRDTDQIKASFYRLSSYIKMSPFKVTFSVFNRLILVLAILAVVFTYYSSTYLELQSVD